MIPELGHLALWLAVAVALVQLVGPTLGLARHDGRLIALAGRAALLHALLVLAAFLALMWAFWSSDFSVALVAGNSHTDKPDLYKITGVWANHEGSMLLWVLMLALSGAALALFGGAIPLPVRARVLSAQAALALGFHAFLLVASNPFARLVPAPAQGAGLNPLLQDPGLAFHPPMLYAGYVGLSVVFSFAVAGLIDGGVGRQWARWLRPWALAAWSALTLGLGLGGWWAYYELGWGGFWFWDPVENAALMPWLAATALLHSLSVLEKRDALRIWSVLLAVLAFSLSMLGTFIVRSGLLTSVHAFAVDPQRGLFILALLAIYIGVALVLFAWRAPSLEAGALFAPVSREGLLVANNLLLAAALGTVFVGTLYPLALEAAAGQTISVGAPYFNATFVPLMLPLMLIMAAGPFLPWRRSKTPGRHLRWLATPTLLGLGAGAWALARAAPGDTPVVLGVGVAVLLAVAAMLDVARRVRRRAQVWSLGLGHTGLAVLALGIAVVSGFETEVLTPLKPGGEARIGGYVVRLAGVAPVAGRNYTAVQATLLLERDGQPVAVLQPQQRTYSDPVQETTEAAIEPTPLGDIYAVLGAPDGKGAWQVRLHWKPMVGLIWAGVLLMAAGGLVGAVGDRRVARRLVRPALRGALTPAPAE